MAIPEDAGIRTDHGTVEDPTTPSICNVVLACEVRDLVPRRVADPAGVPALPPTAGRSSYGVCDYADFVTVGTATTSTFSLDIGIIRRSA